jgi:hypothetical protein
LHESKKQLGAALAPVFKSHGYRKRAMTWHRPAEDTIRVFHVEKNRWGENSYDLACAIYLTPLGAESTPPVHRCPIQVGMDHLVPDSEYLDKICDFENRFLKLSQRLDAIVEVVREHAIPWLDQYSSIATLKSLVATPYDILLPKVRIWRYAYDYLRELAGSA